MGNSVNDSIEIEDEEVLNQTEQENSFKLALKEMGYILFEKYPDKTSNLSHENINGIVRIRVLNEYMETNFGYRYKTLDALVDAKLSTVVSHKGFGIDKLIEFMKSIQASFEQTQLPEGLKSMLSRR
jgi:hypothetical protein